MEQQMNPAILKGSERVKCEQCGGIFFEQVNLLQKISKFKIGSPTDIVVPMTIHRCMECGTPIKEELQLINDIVKPAESTGVDIDNVKSIAPKRNSGLIIE